MKRAGKWVLIKDFVEHLYDKNMYLHCDDYMILCYTDDFVYDKMYKIHRGYTKLNKKKSFLNPSETVELAKQYDG